MAFVDEETKGAESQSLSSCPARAMDPLSDPSNNTELIRNALAIVFQAA